MRRAEIELLEDDLDEPTVSCWELGLSLDPVRQEREDEEDSGFFRALYEHPEEALGPYAA